MTDSLRSQAEAWIPHTPECDLTRIAEGVPARHRPWKNVCTCPREAFLVALSQMEATTAEAQAQLEELRECEYRVEGNGVACGECVQCLTVALAQLAAERANEGELLRWFSDRLTGGAAGTWDEIKHACESLAAERDRLTALVEQWRQFADDLAATTDYQANYLAQRHVASLRQCADALAASLQRGTPPTETQ